MTSPVYGGPDPSNTPLHEVAHGIVARELGGRNIRLRVFESSRYDIPELDCGVVGLCSFGNDLPGPTDLERLRAGLTMIVAGRAAVHMWLGRNPLELYPQDTPSQICQFFMELERSPAPNARAFALRELKEMFGDELQAQQWLDAAAGRILERAVEILRSHWTEVARLTARLETEKDMRI